MAKIYRCTTPFTFDVDGASRVVSVDEVISVDDPTFAARQELFADTSLFEPLDDYLQRRTGGVEQATAAPGERRSVQPPVKPSARTGRKAADTKDGDSS